MSLKSKTIKLDSGRDAGKTFLITEMPILKADAWATKALFAIAKSGQDAGDVNLRAGMLEMAKFAFAAIGGIEYEVGQSLLNELLDCVQIIPNGGVARNLHIESDIQDIKTLFLLRKEAFMLHIDFLADGSSPGSSS